jgi:hypothetical protein
MSQRRSGQRAAMTSTELQDLSDAEACRSRLRYFRRKQDRRAAVQPKSQHQKRKPSRPPLIVVEPAIELLTKNPILSGAGIQ